MKEKEEKYKDALGSLFLNIERFEATKFEPKIEEKLENSMNRKSKIVVIIDPNPAENKFYENFFLDSEFAKANSHNEGVSLVNKAIENKNLNAIVIDDSLENSMAPMLVSLFRLIQNKKKLDYNIFVTYSGSINVKRYSTKPDAIINKDDGSIEVF